MELNILYEDRSLVVCEKPIGVLSQKDESGKGTDMLTLLNEHFLQNGERREAFVLHRLDAAVGGVMVYAKTKEAAASLSGAIARGELDKEYFALCEGDVSSDLGQSGELCDLLFRDAKKNKSYVTDRMRKGVKEAKLAYRVLAVGSYEGETLSLVRVKLFTGRTHQIRVQFSSRGHSLVGDKRYGARQKADAIGLFSAMIGFCHPKNREYMTFSLPHPQGGAWEAVQEEGELL